MTKVNINGPTEGDISRIPRNTGNEQIRPESESSPAATANSHLTSDQVNLSDRGATIRRLIDQSKQLPDVRQDRIDSLNSQIESGSYKPSATDIADAIIKDQS
jgi:negative regulator of flagellin synthesis FlgM